MTSLTLEALAANRSRYSSYREMPRNDKRRATWREQRRTRGFDSTELWSLDHTIAHFMIDACEVYRDAHRVGVKPRLPRSKATILAQIMTGFRLHAREDFCLATREECAYVDRAVTAFLQHGDRFPELRDAFARWVTPRLAAFAEATKSYPPTLTPERWSEMVKTMAKGFAAVAEGKTFRRPDGRLQPGLALFRRWFWNLWS